MKSVTVTGGCEVNAAARRYLNERVDELKAEHGLLTDLELVVRPSGKSFMVLLKGNLPRHGHCESKATGDTLHDAVNTAIERFESRLRKQEGRLQEHRADALKETEARLAEADED